MKHPSVLHILFAATLLSGCSKELEIDYGTIEPLTVIEGTLTDAGATVSLTLTTPMDEPMDTVRLTDAAVSITDLADGSVHSLAPDAQGLYTAAMTGVAGRSYRLDVERDGAVHSSTCVMQSPVEILDLGFQWIKMPYDEVAVLRILLADPAASTDSYWVRIFRNGEVYKWADANDRFAVDGTVEISMMTARKNPSDPDDEDQLRDGDVLTVTAVRVPAHVHDYLNDLSMHTIGGPTTFTGPSLALGYFLAAPVTIATLTYRPDSF